MTEQEIIEMEIRQEKADEPEVEPSYCFEKDKECVYAKNFMSREEWGDEPGSECEFIGEHDCVDEEEEDEDE